MDPSARPRQRFQRGSCSLTPVSTCRNRKLSASKRAPSHGAAHDTSRARRYTRQSASGTAVNNRLTSRKNCGWATLSSDTVIGPAVRK